MVSGEETAEPRGCPRRPRAPGRTLNAERLTRNAQISALNVLLPPAGRSPSGRRWPAALLALALLLLTPPAARAWLVDEPSHLLCAGLGVVEVLDDPGLCTWNFELRPAFAYRHVRPWLFFGTGRHDTFYAAGGVLVDFALGERWRLTPSFGAGYFDSRRMSLGYHAEFRSGIELSRRFRNGQRLGLAFAHLSNGSLGERNPGTETLGLIWCLPLDALLGPR